MADQISLGGFIDLLAQRPADHFITYDFAGLVPTSFASYRGYYDQLALGWGADCARPTVGQLLKLCGDTVGETFEGWKGGDYRMTLRTPLWVANPGNTGSTAIVGLHPQEYWTYIATEFHD